MWLRFIGNNYSVSVSTMVRCNRMVRADGETVIRDKHSTQQITTHGTVSEIFILRIYELWSKRFRVRIIFSAYYDFDSSNQQNYDMHMRTIHWIEINKDMRLPFKQTHHVFAYFYVFVCFGKWRMKMCAKQCTLWCLNLVCGPSLCSECFRFWAFWVISWKWDEPEPGSEQYSTHSCPIISPYSRL